VLYLRLIILSVRDDVPVDSETLLMTDFINLKIKSTQSFRCVHRDRVCIRVLIEVSARTCMSIYVCTVFIKKKVSFIQKLLYDMHSRYSSSRTSSTTCGTFIARVIFDKK
jgi:hypothetical protein